MTARLLVQAPFARSGELGHFRRPPTKVWTLLWMGFEPGCGLTFTVEQDSAMGSRFPHLANFVWYYRDSRGNRYRLGALPEDFDTILAFEDITERLPAPRPPKVYPEDPLEAVVWNSEVMELARELETPVKRLWQDCFHHGGIHRLRLLRARWKMLKKCQELSTLQGKELQRPPLGLY